MASHNLSLPTMKSGSLYAGLAMGKTEYLTYLHPSVENIFHIVIAVKFINIFLLNKYKCMIHNVGLLSTRQTLANKL